MIHQFTGQGVDICFEYGEGDSHEVVIRGLHRRTTENKNGQFIPLSHEQALAIAEGINHLMKTQEGEKRCENEL